MLIKSSLWPEVVISDFHMLRLLVDSRLKKKKSFFDFVDSPKWERTEKQDAKIKLLHGTMEAEQTQMHSELI